MQLKIRLSSYTLIFQIVARRTRKELIHGYTNRCIDGKYIVFLDYDRIDFDWIKEELKHLQTMFSLGDFYIFQSSEESYHAVCLDKIELNKYVQVLKNSSVDVNYVNVPLYFGRKIWTLRLTDKDKLSVRFVGKFKSIGKKMQSSAHADVLNKLFNLKIKLNYPDNKKKLVLAQYPI